MKTNETVIKALRELGQAVVESGMEDIYYDAEAGDTQKDLWETANLVHEHQKNLLELQKFLKNLEVK
jgi:ATP-dependent RNA circularization protein (DNA/RNA ligase family)